MLAPSPLRDDIRQSTRLELLQAAAARGGSRRCRYLEKTVDLLDGAVWYRLLVDGSAKQVEELVEQLQRGYKLELEQLARAA